MKSKPQISSAAIVALGSFNPLIFRPEWLRKKEIISDAELEGISNETIVHPELSTFKLPWGVLAVERERFSITAVQEPIVRACDFAINCFLHLSETPVSAVGINRLVHVPTSGRDAQNRIGDALAPKGVWGDFVSDGGRQAGGMRSITMEQSIEAPKGTQRIDGLSGYIRVQVEPSVRIVHGVYVQVNDHVGLSHPPDFADARAAAESLGNRWQKAKASAEKMIDRVMELGDA